MACGQTRQCRCFNIQVLPTIRRNGACLTTPHGSAHTRLTWRTSTNLAISRNSALLVSFNWSPSLRPMPDLPPQRILMTGDTVGGVWTFTLELARQLTARGAEV